MTLDAALQQAIAHHQAGRLHEAEQLYRAILQADPNQPDANHNIGVLAGQFGQHAAGLPNLKIALALKPAQGQYSLSYADALLATGQAHEALSIMQAALQRGFNTQAAQAMLQKAQAAVLTAPATGAAPTPAEKSQLIALFNAGHFAELENQAHLLIARYPASGFLWSILGGALHMQGKNALPALQKTAELMPDDAAAHNNLGNALKELGQLDGALASYQRALEIKPDLAQAHSNLGSVFLELGQFDDARERFVRAVALQPDFADAHYNLANSLRSLGRLDEAAASYKRALDFKPDWVQAHGNLGNVLQALGQHNDAIACYRHVLEIQPDNATAHFNLGNVLRDNGQLDAAVTSYQRALQFDPDCAETHLNLGTVLKTMGQLDGALQNYRRALQVKPDLVDAHINMGNTLKELDQADKAIECYRRALEIDPGSANAHSNLSTILRDFGRFDEALASCRRALEIDPEFAEAHSNLGNVLRDLGQFDAAAASYRRALAIRPDYAQAHGNLATVLLDLGQLNEAIASCRRALELQPDHVETLSNLGNALWGLGECDQTILAYQKALAIDPDSITAVWLVILHYLAGDMAQCRQMLDRSQHVMTSTKPEHLPARNFRGYVDLLLQHSSQLREPNFQSRQLDHLYVIGESHCLAAHGEVVRYRERELRCSADLVMGCKQWHLGNDQANQYKRKFEMAMARLPQRSSVLLTFGEIDCRADEGILKATKGARGKSLEEAARSTVQDYVSYVARVNVQHGHQIVIGGVPAPNISLSSLSAETAQQLVRLIRLFNVILREQANVTGMDFLDVYSLSDRGDGIASGDWHIDNYHLFPKAAVEAFDKHCIRVH